MEHGKLTALGRSSNKLEHLPRSVGADKEQPVFDFDHPDGIVHGVADRLLADAVAACRPGDPHPCCVPHYQSGLAGTRRWIANGGRLALVSGSDDRRAALRSAIFDGDGRRVAVALSKGLRDDLLQLAGDGLLVALAQGVEAAPDLARRCAEQLRWRAWEGDDDLADQLDAALSERPAPMLRPLPVDLEELAGISEGDPAHGGGQIDLRTGEVWSRAAIDYAREVGEDDPDDEDPERWLPVWCEGSREGYRDMEDFIEALSDDDLAERLAIAISGRGAFRRFKDVLERWPGELEAWYAFSDERQRGRARAWLAAAGYASRLPVHDPPT